MKLLLRTFANGPLYKTHTHSQPPKMNTHTLWIFVKLSYLWIYNIYMTKYFSTSQKRNKTKNTRFIYRFSVFSAVFHISSIFFSTSHTKRTLIGKAEEKRLNFWFDYEGKMPMPIEFLVEIIFFVIIDLTTNTLENIYKSAIQLTFFNCKFKRVH